MAAISTGGSGNWSSTTNNAPWPGGTLPTAADTVTILNTHTVTLDSATAVCDSLTINSGGQLAVDGTVDTKLVVDKGITVNGANGFLNLDMSAAPTKKCEIYINADNSTTSSSVTAANLSGKLMLKGAQKTPWTLVNGALTGGTSTSCTVDDATGWRVGDKLVFCTTQAFNSTPRTDLVTIATVNTGTGAVTWTDGTGAGGSVAYDHLDNCLVGNLTRNLIFGPNTADQFAVMSLTTGANGNSAYINDVEFRSCGSGTGFGFDGTLVINSTNSSILGINRCVFYEHQRAAISWVGALDSIPRSDLIYYSTKATSSVNTMSTIKGELGDETNMVVLRGVIGPQMLAPKLRIISPKISGLTGTSSNSPGGILIASYGDATVEGGGIWACKFAAGPTQTSGGPVSFLETWIGKGFSGATYSGAGNDYVLSAGGPTSVTFDACPESTTGGTGLITGALSAPSTEYKFLNRNGSAATQDIYRPKSSASAPVFVRDTTTIKNATASLRIDTLADRAYTREFPVLVKGGQAATILIYARKTGTFSTRPTAQLTGLGTSFAAVTMSTANDTWELLDLSYASGSAPANDGILTLTLSCQAASSLSAYFSGIPLTPFVTRCRHYGYLFDETSPTRTADTTISAAFATADAYTGITITWGATSTIALGASQTFQKLIDYTAAKAIANVGSALPITWAGVADNAALFAQGDITTTGYTLNGGGSLAMGSKTLTASIPWAYTYTGGTFSQAITVPSFSGGTLNIGAAGTYTYTQAAAMILSMTPTAPGTYALGDTTFTGQVDLRNTSGSHAITVELPTGTSYTTTNNTGATITVTVPVVTADISITGMANTTGANNRLQIINQTAAAASAWQAATVYAAGAVVLRTSGVGSENTAGLYMRCTSGGTSGGSEPTWATTVGVTTADNTVTWTTYAVLYYDADPAGTSLIDTYIDGEEFVAGETIEIRFAEEDPGVTFRTYSTSVVATSEGFSALVNESDDDVYATYGLSGAAYESTFSPNYVSSYIVLDANTDFSGKSAYAYYCYLLTTSQGMYRFWGGLTGIDAGNIRNNVGTISLYFDESAGFVKQTDDVRIFRSDNTRPAIDPTTGGSGIEINWRTPVSVVSTGGSALTPTESAQLMALPSASANASAVAAAATSSPFHVDLRKILGGAVGGDGSEANPWGPA